MGTGLSFPHPVKVEWDMVPVSVVARIRTRRWPAEQCLGAHETAGQGSHVTGSGMALECFGPREELGPREAQAALGKNRMVPGSLGGKTKSLAWP